MRLLIVGYDKLPFCRRTLAGPLISSASTFLRWYRLDSPSSITRHRSNYYPMDRDLIDSSHRVAEGNRGSNECDESREIKIKRDREVQLLKASTFFFIVIYLTNGRKLLRRYSYYSVRPQLFEDK